MFALISKVLDRVVESRDRREVVNRIAQDFSSDQSLLKQFISEAGLLEDEYEGKETDIQMPSEFILEAMKILEEEPTHQFFATMNELSAMQDINHPDYNNFLLATRKYFMHNELYSGLKYYFNYLNTITGINEVSAQLESVGERLMEVRINELTQRTL